MRIVSLVPSVTETLLSWDVMPIACTRFCEQEAIPAVGGTKDPNVEEILRLSPDLVVLDAEENRREDYEALVAVGLDTLALHVRSLSDVAPALDSLARRIGLDWAPKTLPDAVAPRRSAFVPIWRRPWIALGEPTYGASLLRHLGVTTVYLEAGPYPRTTLDEARQRGPSLVLAPSEPYPFSERQLDELSSVGPTIFLDGKDLFWWGERTPGALLRLGVELERSRLGSAAKRRC